MLDIYMSDNSIISPVPAVHTIPWYMEEKYRLVNNWLGSRHVNWQIEATVDRDNAK